MYMNDPRLASHCALRKVAISARSEVRAASLPGTVPRPRRAFARVKTVVTGVEAVLGVRGVGVERPFLVGVKSETVRFAETGVRGRAGGC
jgi:hypothetical protein